MKTTENPMGTDGFEFIEFASPRPDTLITLFQKMGFTAIAQHRTKIVTLFRQGKINFILNNEPNSHGVEFAKRHGSCACAMAFKVKDANAALERAIALGAKPYLDGKVGKGEQMIPAIYGMGGSLLYFVDNYQDKSIYETDFIPIKGIHQYPEGQGLLDIDHLTQKWISDFYVNIFNFRKIRGLKRTAIESPCGKIKILLNESQNEGLQHIALSTTDIYHCVENLRYENVNFLSVPPIYYEMINERIKNHHEDIERMEKNQILVDGKVSGNQVELLLHIFTEDVIGPLFFEIIQRKGSLGFGEERCLMREEVALEEVM